MKVTLKQIAERAGVHISTVDKVIHNRGGVSKEVADNIRKIIKELGYKTNPTGRALQRSGKRYRIAVLLLKNDAVDDLRKGIHDAVQEMAFQVETTYIVTGVRDSQAQADYIDFAVEKHYDGLIIMPIYSKIVSEAIDRAAQAGVPAITVNSDISESGRLCYIGQFGEQEAAIAGRVMGVMLQGRGDVAIVTSSLHPDQADLNVKVRESRFAEYLQKHYPEIRIVHYIECFEDRIIAQVEMEHLLQERPELSGIYVTCGCVDTVAKAVKRAGREKQIAILGFEDYPEILKLIREDVIDCTIAGELLKMGKQSIIVMMDYLVQGTEPENCCTYMDVRVLFKECICAPDEV
ncbi:MAG: LacI family DNA-binding transcriptional regulator [Eubacterium sp.]|nr:LacI family DNA-binding transcriptional regulator [Eubacterium sp.]